MSSLQQLFTSRKPYDASTFVAGKGKIFYDETSGALRIGDGTTPGGKPITYPLASTSTIGGIKLGPGVILNGDNQVIIDSTGLSFNFGDFQATTPAGGAATLSSINEGQNIDIVSNANGYINVVGNFHVHRTQDYDPNTPDADGAVFAVKTDGQIQMKVPLSDSTTGALEIVGNDTGLFLSPNQTGVILHVTGNSGLVSRNYFDANANYVVVAGRRYNGTQLAPRRVLSGEPILRIAGQAAVAATANGDATFPTFGPARIEFTATEDQTPTAQGGEVRILATANGSIATSTGTLVASFNATTGLTATKFNGPLTGNVTGTATTATYAQSFNTGTLVTQAVSAISATTAGTVTTAAQPAITSVGTLTNLAIATGGTITTPRVVINDGGLRTISGGTTCTIDFATDSIILWTAPSGTAAITLQNYTAGARVRLIIAMTTSRDITYGISSVALSSTGADNWNGAGGGAVDITNTAVHLDYTCITTASSGCYVAVTAN